jgi:hypothetical protein
VEHTSHYGVDEKVILRSACGDNLAPNNAKTVKLLQPPNMGIISCTNMTIYILAYDFDHRGNRYLEHDRASTAYAPVQVQDVAPNTTSEVSELRFPCLTITS